MWGPISPFASPGQSPRARLFRVLSSPTPSQGFRPHRCARHRAKNPFRFAGRHDATQPPPLPLGNRHRANPCAVRDAGRTQYTARAGLERLEPWAIRLGPPRRVHRCADITAGRQQIGHHPASMHVVRGHHQRHGLGSGAQFGP
jgi:hypothetical protein